MRLSIAPCALAGLLTVGQALADVTYHGPNKLHYRVLEQKNGTTIATLEDKSEWHTLGNYLLDKLDHGETYPPDHCARLECFVELCFDEVGSMDSNLLGAAHMLMAGESWIEAPKSVVVVVDHLYAFAGQAWPNREPWTGKKACKPNTVSYKARVYVDRNKLNIDQKHFDLKGNVPNALGSWLGRCAHNKKVSCPSEDNQQSEPAPPVTGV